MPSNEPRVLIVESHDILRVMLFTILRHQPLGVDTAASTAEALEKVATCDYALIVLDMDMPNDEAEEFLHAFREARPQATSFVIAVRDPNEARFIDPTKVSAVLNKPLELDTFAEIVRETAPIVPLPDEPMQHCPPTESEMRSKMERHGHLAN